MAIGANTGSILQPLCYIAEIAGSAGSLLTSLSGQDAFRNLDTFRGRAYTAERIERKFQIRGNQGSIPTRA